MFKNIGISALLITIGLAVPAQGAPAPKGPDSGFLEQATLVQPLDSQDSESDSESGSQESRKGLRVPEVAPDSLNPIQDGEDGTQILLLRYETGNAQAVKLHIEGLRLTPGTVLFVYGIEDGKAVDVQGPFEGSGPGLGSDFWTMAVRGREAFVELQASETLPSDLPFRVTEIAPSELEVTTGDAQTFSEAPGEIQTGHYRGVDVAFEVKDGLAIFEGDVVLGAVEDIEPARGVKGDVHEALAISGSRYRWPGGVIPYTVDPRIVNNSRIYDAVSHWNSTLGGTIRLVPRSSEYNHVHFVWTSSSTRCASNVGMQGFGIQYVYVGDLCKMGNMIHEIGHAVGLWHEQSREDRNSYVSILTQNILSSSLFNFSQNISNGDDVGQYDYGSIMHYGAYSFSANGLPTIQTIPAGIPIGQRIALSSKDIAGVRTMYGYSAPTATTTTTTSPTTTTTTTALPTNMTANFQTNPSGLPITVDGVTRNAPFSLSWTVGTVHTISAVNVNGSTQSTFVSWSHGGAQTQTITASTLQTVFTANYSVKHKVQVSASPYGTGSVTLSPASSDGYYAHNSYVTVSASAAPGYCFSGWSGLISGTSSSTGLTVTSPYTITANFGYGAVYLTAAYLTASHYGSTSFVGVKASSGCPWRAVSNVSWITLTQSTTSGNGYVTIRTAPNYGGGRYGTVTIGNQTITVYQQ